MSSNKNITTEKALAIAREAAKANIKAIQKKQMVMHKKYHGASKNPLYYVWPVPPTEVSEPVARTESTECMDLKTGKSEASEAYVPQKAPKPSIEKNYGCKYFDRVDAPYLEEDAPKTTENWVSIYKNCFVDPHGSVPIDEATNMVAGLTIPKGINAPPMFAWKRTGCPEAKKPVQTVCGIDGCREPVYVADDSSLADVSVADESIAAAVAAHVEAPISTEDPKVRPYFYAWGSADALQQVRSEIDEKFPNHHSSTKQTLSLKALATSIDLTDGLTERSMDVQSEYQAAISHSKSGVTNAGNTSRRASKNDLHAGIGEKIAQEDAYHAPPTTGYTGHMAHDEVYDPSASPLDGHTDVATVAATDDLTVTTLVSEFPTSAGAYSANDNDSITIISTPDQDQDHQDQDQEREHERESAVIRHTRGLAGNKTLTRSPAKATLATSVLHLAPAATKSKSAKGSKTMKAVGKPKAQAHAQFAAREFEDDISITDMNSVGLNSDAASVPADNFEGTADVQPSTPAPASIEEGVTTATAPLVAVSAVTSAPTSIPAPHTKKASKRYDSESHSKYLAPKVAYAKFADALNRPVAGAKSGVNKAGIDTSRPQGDFFGADPRDSNYKRSFKPPVEAISTTELPTPPVTAVVSVPMSLPPTPPAAPAPPAAPTPPPAPTVSAPVVSSSRSVCSSEVSVASTTPSSSNGRYRVMSDTASDSQMSGKYRSIVAHNKAVREGTSVNLDRGTHYNSSAPITVMRSTVFAPMRQGNYIPPVISTGNFSNMSGCIGGNPILAHKRYPQQSDKQVGRWSSEMARSNRTAFETRRRTNPSRNCLSR